MKKIYFVRHGSTSGNEEGGWQTFEHPLSETGRKQIKLLAERFIAIPVDVVIASDMARAFETGKAIAERIGKEVITSKLFHERHRPTAIRGKSKKDPEALKIHGVIKDIFMRAADEHHSDEENFLDQRRRAGEAVRFLEGRPENHIVVATHGTFLRLILTHILLGPSFTPQEFMRIDDLFIMTNTGVTVFEYDPNSKETLDGWLLITWNDKVHLD